MSALKSLVSKNQKFDSTSLSAEIHGLNIGDRFRYLNDHLGSRMLASTSFGLQSPVMLQLLHLHAPDIPVIFVDTGFLFPETYQYAEKLMELIPLDYRIYQPKLSAARLEAVFGKIWETEKGTGDQYGLITKVEPMNRALNDLRRDVWLSGLRRSQSATRQDRPFVEAQKKTLKVYPILDWADIQVDLFFREHKLPEHPLAAKGYVTMGDWHSTKPSADGSAEGTRFAGDKFECGLHIDSSTSDFQI